MIVVFTETVLFEEREYFFDYIDVDLTVHQLLKDYRLILLLIQFHALFYILERFI
jgi:hypothetical protein